jgi:hypothetical protein
LRKRKKHTLCNTMDDFILLFSSMPWHLKCFKTVNEITHKIYDFILETVYIQFYLDKTILSFFINSLTYHQKILCDTSFIENESPIENSLTRLIYMCLWTSHSSYFHISSRDNCNSACWWEHQKVLPTLQFPSSIYLT